MDKRTAITIAGALVLAMMAGIVSHEFTLRKPLPVQIVVQNPAQPAAPAAPHQGEGD
jgi:Flp pilus assembly protein CpaB